VIGTLKSTDHPKLQLMKKTKFPKPLPHNAHGSIRDNLEPESNVTEESDFHSQKHIMPKISTDKGITI
jgi:hypothetical protein